MSAVPARLNCDGSACLYNRLFYFEMKIFMQTVKQLTNLLSFMKGFEIKGRQIKILRFVAQWMIW